MRLFRQHFEMTLAALLFMLLSAPLTAKCDSDGDLFKEKLVHLDLKGAPLSISYMSRVFPLLRKLGATGILIEYEDMFPYKGKLASLSARNHYSEEDIDRILGFACRNKLRVVPLVQTFGHLEFALKLQDNIDMREDAGNPQALCPSRQNSRQLVREMLHQVADRHRPTITHFHIGSDEVFTMGQCERCKQRLKARNYTKANLFLDHVSAVINEIKGLGLRPVMWDDMLRKVDLDLLKKYHTVLSSTDLMVWNYRSDSQDAMAAALAKYQAAGLRSVWVASAFKGGISPTAQMPNYTFHLDNHMMWQRIVKQFGANFDIQGIALTGWQRFDHFAGLCELFPVGLPVLALCLAYLSTGSYDNKTLIDVQQKLGCDRQLPVNVTDAPIVRCDYPGANIYVGIQQLQQLLSERASIENSNYYQGWMGPMNRLHNFSSPSSVQNVLNKLSAVFTLESGVRDSVREIANVSDRASLHEWLESFLEPHSQWAWQAFADVQRLLARKSWPRRPFYAAP